MTPKQKPTILIIEDRADFREIYSDVLGSAGYKVDEASTGEEGLKKANEITPDLILLDLYLPQMHGFSVLEELRTNSATKAIPVVIFSFSNDPNDIKKGLELGAHDYLVKGFYTPKAVVSKLKSLLSSPGSKAKAPAYRLALAEGRLDAARLQHDLELKKLFRCVSCSEALVVELESNPNKNGEHTFQAILICSVCERRY